MAPMYIHDRGYQSLSWGKTAGRVVLFLVDGGKIMNTRIVVRGPSPVLELYDGISPFLHGVLI